MITASIASTMTTDRVTDSGRYQDGSASLMRCWTSVCDGAPGVVAEGFIELTTALPPSPAPDAAEREAADDPGDDAGRVSAAPVEERESGEADSQQEVDHRAGDRGDRGDGLEALTSVPAYAALSASLIVPDVESAMMALITSRAATR